MDLCAKMTTVKNSYFQGIRGLAILSIIVSHCNFGSNSFGINYTTWFGAFGVSVFIVMSGYLLMEKHSEDKIVWIQYVWRKVKRIYPLHFITLIGALLLEHEVYFKSEMKTLGIVLINALGIQSWIPNSQYYFSLNAVSWYVSIVIFTAIIAPLLVVVFRKISTRISVYILVACILFEFVWYKLFSTSVDAHWIIYIFPFARSVDFIAGVCIWKVRKSVTVKADSVIRGIAITLLIIEMIISVFSNSEIFSAFAWIIPSLMLVWANEVKCERVNTISRVLNSIFVFVGNISFELFLLHQLCIRYSNRVLLHIGITNEALGAVLGVGATFIVASIWNRYIDNGLILRRVHRR